MKAKGQLFLLIVLIIGSSFYMFHKPTPLEIQTPVGFPKMPVNVNNKTTIEGVELGRFLFYDSILSLDFSMNCASCHQQKNAFATSNQFDVGVNGDTLKRNTLPLFNLAWYSGMFWDKRTSSIESQVFIPVRKHDEMNLDWSIAEERLQNSKFYRDLFLKAFGTIAIDSVLISRAIAQFERTLISANSKFDQSLRGEARLSKDEYKGYDIVNDRGFGDCLNCHTTDAHALSTNGGYANNGLENVNQLDDYLDLGLGGTTINSADNGKFKVPSLRNLSFTAPYMHDGRFKTLEEVVGFYANDVNHSAKFDNKMTHYSNGRKRLDSTEQRNIVAFLKTLNDSSFISNSEFSNPFWRN